MSRPVPVNRECSFELQELFFSTTDFKGAVRDGNEVFKRVAGYTEEELIGAPHSIIRHPDMPRSVFKLLWDYIEEGKTIAAYVKNLAKDGQFYWVLAVVQPCDGGYLSIRLKPSSPLFQAAMGIYKETLEVERQIEHETGDRREAMAAGLARALELLEQAGYDDYSSFMWDALSVEIASRRSELSDCAGGAHAPSSIVELGASSFGDTDAQHLHDSFICCQRIERQLDHWFQSVDSFKVVNAQLREKSDDIMDVADSVRMQSLNASIEASRSGRTGNTLDAVANSLGIATVECARTTEHLTTSMESVAELLAKLIFGVAVAKLQSEMCTYFLRELQGGQQSGHSEHESERIRESLGILLSELKSRVAGVFAVVEQCDSEFALLEKYVSGLKAIAKELRFVELAGQKESVHQKNGSKFTIVFDEIREGIEFTKSQTQELETSIVQIRRQVLEIRKRKSELLADADALCPGHAEVAVS